MTRCRLSRLIAFGALLLSAIIFAGCGGQSSPVVGGYGSQLAQTLSPTAQTAQPITQTVLPAATSVLPVNATAGITATGTISDTAGGTATSTSIAGTPTPRPIPTGTPPDPMDQLNIYEYFSSANTLVRQDVIQLDGTGPNEVLYTLTGPDTVITGENRSNINVLTYDPTYREWNFTWSSQAISGTASPLLSANQRNLGGLNGGDLLRSGAPIFILRTTTMDGRAHLQLIRWNASAKTGEALKVAPAGGGAERDTFDADLDLNVADLNDDGVYEVVGDNSSGVQVWKWDGQKYVPQEQR